MPIHICHDALNIEVTDFSILLISKYKQYKKANIANFVYCEKNWFNFNDWKSVKKKHKIILDLSTRPTILNNPKS